MLFPYIYVPHKIEKMQTFIDFIFHEVWCKATPKIAFSFNSCSENPELFEVMKKFFYSDKKNADFFYGNVERIYSHFACLKPKHIRRMKWWYFSNNDIERLCANNPVLHPVHYKDIERRYPDLAKDLRIFFTGLYDFEASALKAEVGDIDNHYQAFVTANNSTKCPFCGINDLLGEDHTRREAYDHFLPKALYPFNSINFKNLAPACHHCNSSYKTSKDPAYTPKNSAGESVRRKIFYPFSTAPYVIDMQITLQHADIDNLTPADVNLAFGPADIAEQIDTWKDIYGIVERYRGKLLGGDGKAWLVEVLDEWRWKDESGGAEGKTPDEYLRDVCRHTNKSPYANSNFLKNGFLQGCKAVGLFELTAKGKVAP